MGYRVGDLEVHPGLAAEFGYDSNFFRRAETEDPIGALRLRITPSISLSTLSPQRRGEGGDAAPPDFEFRTGLAATYNEFFPVSGSDAGQDLMSDQRNVGGVFDLRLAILPRRPWSGNVHADIGRLIQPSPQGFTNASFNRFHGRAGGELVYTPGGGLLDWRLGYDFGGTLFEDDNFNQLTSLRHNVMTRGRWRFLPRTALMYDASVGFINYPQPVFKTNSTPVRTRLGLNGLVTPSLAITALAGWGASFYEGRGGAPAEDFDSVIGQLDFKWYLTPNPGTDPAGAGLALSSVSVGYSRDFYDSFIGTYFEWNRGYANLSYFFGGRFLILVDAGVGPVSYPTVPELALSPWTDIRVDASLFAEYRLMDSIGLNTTIRYGTNISDQNITILAGGSDSLQWQQLEAYLGVRWLM